MTLGNIPPSSHRWNKLHGVASLHVQTRLKYNVGEDVPIVLEARPISHLNFATVYSAGSKVALSVYL